MKQVVGIAEVFADHLTAGRIQEAASLLAPVTQSIGGAIKLQDLYRQILTKFGKVVSRQTLHHHELNGVYVVYFTFQFERGALPGCVMCTMDGKVESFIFKHPDQLKNFDFLKGPGPR